MLASATSTFASRPVNDDFTSSSAAALVVDDAAASSGPTSVRARAAHGAAIIDERPIVFPFFGTINGVVLGCLCLSGAISWLQS